MCCYINFAFFLTDYTVLRSNDVEWLHIMDLRSYVSTFKCCKLVVRDFCQTERQKRISFRYLRHISYKEFSAYMYAPMRMRMHRHVLDMNQLNVYVCTCIEKSDFVNV